MAAACGIGRGSSNSSTTQVNSKVHCQCVLLLHYLPLLPVQPVCCVRLNNRRGRLGTLGGLLALKITALQRATGHWFPSRQSVALNAQDVPKDYMELQYIGSTLPCQHTIQETAQVHKQLPTPPDDQQIDNIS